MNICVIEESPLAVGDLLLAMSNCLKNLQESTDVEAVLPHSSK